jgi:hypothetical protein
MGRRTIYISEDDTVADILEGCPLALRVMEKYFGRDFLCRGDLDKISLGVAVALHRQAMHPILVELNRICL